MHEPLGRVPAGAVVTRNKPCLAAMRPRDEALALSTAHFADVVMPKSDVALPGSASASPTPQEVRFPVQIIHALGIRGDPRRYKDTYISQLKQLVKAETKGMHIVAGVPVQERTSWT